MMSQSTNKSGLRSTLKGKSYPSWIGQSSGWLKNVTGMPDKVTNIDPLTKLQSYSGGNVIIAVFITSGKVNRVKVQETYTSPALATTAYLLACRTLLITGFNEVGGTANSKTFQNDSMVASVVLVRYASNQNIVTDYQDSKKIVTPN
jgi:hypothetical protein